MFTIIIRLLLFYSQFETFNVVFKRGFFTNMLSENAQCFFFLKNVLTDLYCTNSDPYRLVLGTNLCAQVDIALNPGRVITCFDHIESVTFLSLSSING